MKLRFGHQAGDRIEGIEVPLGQPVTWGDLETAVPGGSLFLTGLTRREDYGRGVLVRGTMPRPGPSDGISGRRRHVAHAIGGPSPMRPARNEADDDAWAVWADWLDTRTPAVGRAVRPLAVPASPDTTRVCPPPLTWFRDREPHHFGCAAGVRAFADPHIELDFDRQTVESVDRMIGALGPCSPAFWWTPRPLTSVAPPSVSRSAVDPVTDWEAAVEALCDEDLTGTESYTAWSDALRRPGADGVLPRIAQAWGEPPFPDRQAFFGGLLLRTLEAHEHACHRAFFGPRYWRPVTPADVDGALAEAGIPLHPSVRWYLLHVDAIGMTGFRFPLWRRSGFTLRRAPEVLDDLFTPAEARRMVQRVEAVADGATVEQLVHAHIVAPEYGHTFVTPGGGTVFVQRHSRTYGDAAAGPPFVEWVVRRRAQERGHPVHRTGWTKWARFP